MQLEEIINLIEPLNEKYMKLARERQDNLFKPLGSLGELEEMSIKLAGIYSNISEDISKKAMLVFCSDNGVWEEGISSNPQSVTARQTENFLKGYSAISILSKTAKSDLFVVDVGIKEDFELGDVIDRKIRKGTDNISKGPGMTVDEARKAIIIGVDMVKDLKEKNYKVIGTGEMGVGNTTTSSAVIMALTDCSIDDAVGKGAGISKEVLELKKRVVENALEINKPSINDPLDIISKVGGFDIAALCGVYLAAAYYKIPVVIDGIISISAALLAYKFNPLTKDYMFASHLSKEKGYKVAAKELGLKSYFDFSMRLGEGSGCPFTFFALDSAINIIRDMRTFNESNVDKDDYIDIRE